MSAAEDNTTRDEDEPNASPRSDSSTPPTDQRAPASIRETAPASSDLSDGPNLKAMEQAEKSGRLRRIFLRVVITAVSISAVLGLTAVIFGPDDDFFFRLLATSMTISGYFTLALAPAAATERGRAVILSHIGLGVAGLGLALMLLLIWFNESLDDDDSIIGQFMEVLLGRGWMEVITGLAIMYPFYFAAVTLLCIARRPPKKAGIVRNTAIVSGSIAVTMLTVMMIYDGWEQLFPFDEEYVIRFVVGCLIIAGTSAIIMPVMLRIESSVAASASRPAEHAMRLVCPRCGLDQMQPTGHSACPQCRLGFNIILEEPLCDSCNYPLNELDADICPECGETVPEHYRNAVIEARLRADEIRARRARADTAGHGATGESAAPPTSPPATTSQPRPDTSSGPNT